MTRWDRLWWFLRGARLVTSCCVYIYLALAFAVQLKLCLQILLPVLWDGEPREGGALAKWFLVEVLATVLIPFFTVSNAKCGRALCAMATLAWMLLAALCRGAIWLAKALNATRSAAAIASSSPGQPADPRTQLQLIAVTPVLLSYLPPADRLLLWQANRQLALAVWSSCPTVQLTLTSKWSGLLDVFPGQLRLALPLLLESKRPSCIPEGIFFRHIQRLSLGSMQLKTSDFNDLTPLLPNLNHVSLLNCGITATPLSQPAAAARPNAARRRNRQTLLRLSSFSCLLTQATLPAALAPLDVHTLRSLTTDDPDVFNVLRAGRLPALRVLKLSGGTVNDQQLDTLLLAKPQMQAVCLPELQLRRDHSAQDCSWGVLRLEGNPTWVNSGLHALQLAMLPLAGIQRLIVERELYAWSQGDASDLKEYGCTWSSAWPRIHEAAERMQFVPGITGWGHMWSWSQPGVSQVDLGLQDDELGFTIHWIKPQMPSESASITRTRAEIRSLAALVARRLQGGTLVCSGADLLHPSPLAALQPLDELPSCVQAVVLRDCSHVPRSSEARRLLLAGLPAHVQRLVIMDAHSFTLHPRFLKAEYTRG